jgi:hypothetical protein
MSLMLNSKSFSGKNGDGGFLGEYVDRMNMIACLFSGSMIWGLFEFLINFV